MSVCVRCVRVCVREQCPAGKERVAVLGLDMGLHGDWSEFVQAFFSSFLPFLFSFPSLIAQALGLFVLSLGSSAGSLLVCLIALI